MLEHYHRRSSTATDHRALPGAKLVYQCPIHSERRHTIHSTTVATIQKLCDGLEMTITEFFQSDLFSNIEPEVK